MRIGVIGINHKLASIELREMVAKACHKYFANGKIAHANCAFVLLSTCNRTEVYFSTHELAATHSYILNLLRDELEIDFEQRIYSFFGADCFLHLTRVTSGLDSAILAETEIQGQVRTSYEAAARTATLPAELHFIFQKSLQIAKQARNKLPTSSGQVTLEHSIWRVCRKRGLESPKILLMGASQVNLNLMHYLQRRSYGQITLCNRTIEKAQTYSHSASILPWEKRADWPAYDIIVCATKAPYLLVTKPKKKQVQTKLFFDLAVPRNISSELGNIAPLFDIDKLQNLINMQQTDLEAAIYSAENYINAAIPCHMRTWQQRDLYRKQLAYA